MVSNNESAYVNIHIPRSLSYVDSLIIVQPYFFVNNFARLLLPFSEKLVAISLSDFIYTYQSRPLMQHLYHELEIYFLI